MAKFAFRHQVEWSDMSEHSPSHRGAIPCTVVLPDGERVAMDSEARATFDLALYEARTYEGSRATYLRLHENVRVRATHWGDDGDRRMGCAGTTMEVLAPQGSTFLYERSCPGCGGPTGETESEDAPALWHKSCRAEYDEQEQLMEELRQEIEEEEDRQAREWAAI